MTESQELVTRFQNIFGDSITQAALFFDCSQVTLNRLLSGESELDDYKLLYFSIALAAFENYQSKDGALQVKKVLKRRCSKSRINNFRGRIIKRDPITNRFVSK